MNKNHDFKVFQVRFMTFVLKFDSCKAPFLNFNSKSANPDLYQVRLNLAAALLRLDDSMEDVRVVQGNSVPRVGKS